jgi:hypothetical protein
MAAQPSQEDVNVLRFHWSLEACEAAAAALTIAGPGRPLTPIFERFEEALDQAASEFLLDLCTARGGEQLKLAL